MTRQEMLDKALAHLRKQGEFAKTLYGACCYRTPEGLKCAVGALIPDDRYEPQLENLPATRLVVLAAVGADVDDAVYLLELQWHLHDHLRSFDDLEVAAEKFANQWSLSYAKA